MTEPGKVIVPRDPSRNIDKAIAANYRKADDATVCCLSCVLKHSVPWMWCPRIGRQAEAGMICDKHCGNGCHVDH
jgi:hypothetical protein